MLDEPVDAAYRHVHALLCNATEARITGVLCLIEETWTIVHAIITALHEGMPRPRPFEIEEAGFVAFEKHASEGDLQAFIASVRRGRPTLPDSCRAGKVTGSIVVPSVNFKVREYAERDFRVDWPCTYLEMQGGGLQAPDLHQRFEHFLSRLPTKDPPFIGYRNLGRRLSILGDLRIDGGSFLSVRVPLPLRFGLVHPTSTHEELRVQVEAFGRPANHFVLSACPASSYYDGLTIRRDAFARDGSPTGSFSATVGIKARGPITISLFTEDGQHGVVDTRVTGLPHTPFVVHEHYDSGCQMLKQLLFGEGKEPRNDQHDFAAGVSWLLQMLGFSAMPLGLRSSRKNLTHSPDLIARSPDGHLIIVGECSIAPPTTGKIDKLVARTHSVQVALGEAGIPGARVVPVFFSAVSGCQAHDSAYVVEKEDLEELLRLAEFGGDTSEILPA